jgi:phosphate transport system substrate-binding protein
MKVWPRFLGRLPNSIGYVEYAYVKQNKMTFAQLRSTGTFVTRTTPASKPAAELTGPRASPDLTEQPGKDAWPSLAQRSS